MAIFPIILISIHMVNELFLLLLRTNFGITLIPEDIKSANSIDDFKRKLETFFLRARAYES